jgi:hypothetical protein
MEATIGWAEGTEIPGIQSSLCDPHACFVHGSPARSCPRDVGHAISLSHVQTLTHTSSRFRSFNPLQIMRARFSMSLREQLAYRAAPLEILDTLLRHEPDEGR